MNGTEKRLNEIKVRLEDSLFIAVSRLANADDRTIADYLHHVINLHVNGHGSRLCKSGTESERSIRD